MSCPLLNGVYPEKALVAEESLDEMNNNPRNWNLFGDVNNVIEGKQLKNMELSRSSFSFSVSYCLKSGVYAFVQQSVERARQSFVPVSSQDSIPRIGIAQDTSINPVSSDFTENSPDATSLATRSPFSAEDLFNPFGQLQWSMSKPAPISVPNPLVALILEMLRQISFQNCVVKLVHLFLIMLTLQVIFCLPMTDAVSDAGGGGYNSAPVCGLNEAHVAKNPQHRSEIHVGDGNITSSKSFVTPVMNFVAEYEVIYVAVAIAFPLCLTYLWFCKTQKEGIQRGKNKLYGEANLEVLGYGNGNHDENGGNNVDDGSDDSDHDSNASDDDDDSDDNGGGDGGGGHSEVPHAWVLPVNESQSPAADYPSIMDMSVVQQEAIPHQVPTVLPQGICIILSNIFGTLPMLTYIVLTQEKLLPIITVCLHVDDLSVSFSHLVGAAQPQGNLNAATESLSFLSDDVEGQSKFQDLFSWPTEAGSAAVVPVDINKKTGIFEYRKLYNSSVVSQFLGCDSVEKNKEEIVEKNKKTVGVSHTEIKETLLERKETLLERKETLLERKETLLEGEAVFVEGDEFVAGTTHEDTVAEQYTTAAYVSLVQAPKTQIPSACFLESSEAGDIQSIPTNTARHPSLLPPAVSSSMAGKSGDNKDVVIYLGSLFGYCSSVDMDPVCADTTSIDIFTTSAGGSDLSDQHHVQEPPDNSSNISDTPHFETGCFDDSVLQPFYSQCGSCYSAP